MKQRITVIGDGGWGTCLAIHLVQCGHAVTLWGAFPDYVDHMSAVQENTKFLPGIPLPSELTLTANLEIAFDDVDVIVLAVPSQYLESVLQKAQQGPWEQSLVVSVVKGVDPDSLFRMSQLIRQNVTVDKLVVLSGPTISGEVARKMPAAIVAASEEIRFAEQAQAVFNSERFRVYTSTDVIGVELGGSLKNVIAIACGILDGLAPGTNAKAALVTRGLAEMTRLGVVMGAEERTFAGLSGLGDLMTTCFSEHSRNRTLGEKIGKGATLDEILEGMEQVAEGVVTAKSVHQLSQKYQVEMPITEAVYQVLFEGKSAPQVFEQLLQREPKPESA